MRTSAQNNQFFFNLPIDFVGENIEDKYKLLLEKNFIQYESVIDYINSTIKEIIIPSFQMESSMQNIKRGKEIYWKDARNVFDNFTRELDITFRAVDSYLNYFMLLDVIKEFNLNTDLQYIPYFQVHILDKDGDILYTILYKEILLKSISEVRLSYNLTDFSEKTFTVTFLYNFLDITYNVDDEEPIKNKSLFDLDIKKIDDRKVEKK